MTRPPTDAASAARLPPLRSAGRVVAEPEHVGSENADPALGDVLLPETAIQQRVAGLGTAINRDYAAKNPVLVGILRGSVLFLADLMRHLTISMEVDWLAISSYGGRTSSGVVRLLKDLDRPIAGRHVLLVEDIIDTGLTLNYVLRLLRARQPASLQVCTLLNKPARRMIEQDIAYRGFDIPDAFVVGYGLDFEQRYRNLRDIYVLNPDRQSV